MNVTTRGMGRRSGMLASAGMGRRVLVTWPIDLLLDEQPAILQLNEAQLAALTLGAVARGAITDSGPSLWGFVELAVALQQQIDTAASCPGAVTNDVEVLDPMETSFVRWHVVIAETPGASVDTDVSAVAAVDTDTEIPEA